VLHLYIFYSKLEKHLKDILALELEDWTAPDEISVKNTEWRNYDRLKKRRRTEAGDGAGDNDGHMDANGFYNNDGTVDVDGFDNDCNWFTKVVKWRNEAAVGGKQAVAIL
jgi:hypothetical protein